MSNDELDMLDQLDQDLEQGVDSIPDPDELDEEEMDQEDLDDEDEYDEGDGPSSSGGPSKLVMGVAGLVITTVALGGGYVMMKRFTGGSEPVVEAPTEPTGQSISSMPQPVPATLSQPIAEAPMPQPIAVVEPSSLAVVADKDNQDQTLPPVEGVQIVGAAGSTTDDTYSDLRPVRNAKPENVLNTTVGVSKEELRKILTEVMKENQQQIDLSSIEMPKVEIPNLSDDIDNVEKSVITGQRNNKNAIIAAINGLKSKIAGVEAKMAEKPTVANMSQVSEAKPTSEFKHLLGSRKQLPGFNVIATSTDGEMSIVKSSTGRVNVFFIGEKLRLHGGTTEIVGVYNEGNLVLVGSKWYIDTSRIPAKQRTYKKERTSKPMKAKVENVRDQHGATTPVKLEKVGSTQQRYSQLVKVIDGWTLNGGNENYFIVKNPAGDFVKVELGAEIDGLGTVEGLDVNSDLRVGNNIIQRAK
ncbi:hypothetical protein [Neptuniibacter sp. QD37_11]|uniref:hypothetical protein n=1 Tax=Neptuniibacter sp. QD37_11 TaxID=3398209 RepID=UPI0039F5F65B